MDETLLKLRILTKAEITLLKANARRAAMRGRLFLDDRSQKPQGVLDPATLERGQLPAAVRHARHRDDLLFGRI